MTLTIAPTGSGKTTYRLIKFANVVCISPDDLIVGKWSPQKARDAWEQAEQKAAALFTNGQDFVVDAQFVNASVRSKWIRNAKQHGYIVNAVVFDTPLEQILENHKVRGDRGGYGEVPITAINDFYNKFRVFLENKVETFAQFDNVSVVVWGDESTGWVKNEVR